MKLVILLFGFHFVLGYEESYQGFSSCGEDGWSCTHVKNKYEITYSCPSYQPNARVWVWTARLPSGSTTFIVRDCNHLEVHMDCTIGIRTTVLNQFKVINVTYLEILPPLLPGVFLHDNDQVPHAPPFIHIENVTRIKLYPGLFDKPGGSCKYKFIELTSLTLVNVHVERLMKDLFHNQNMDKLVMKNVVIRSIDNNAMTINADALIMNTTFPYIPSNAMIIKGENISFINNRFQRIQALGLTIRSKNFQFINNTVEEITTQGLNVLGAKIEISKNVFEHLETGAFERVTPGYSPVSYEIASKFIYKFSENILKNINPGSLHLNWEIYKKVCSEIIFQGNIFDCTCTNLGWMSVSNGLGPKISKVKDFYDTYFNKDGNICNLNDHCPLNLVLKEIQNVCNNKTNVSTICATYATVTDAGAVTLKSDWKSTSNLTQETTLPTSHPDLPTEPIEVTEKVVPVLSYTENQTLQMEKQNIPTWLVVLPIFVVLSAISLGLFLWWYKKRKQRQVVTTLYKNERGADADSLIVINEHHNELYDKQ